MRKLFAAAFVIALSTGCVGKQKYDDALASGASCQAELKACNDARDDLKADLSGRNARIKTLEHELTATKNSLDELTSQLAGKIAEAGQLQSSIEDMQEALRELEMRRQQSEAAMASYRDLVKRFQAMIDAGTLKVKVLDGRLVVELATDILFPPGSASLSKDGKQAIKEVAEVLASIPDREYQVAGHTDNDAISTEQFPSNWYLGSARAIEVVNVLSKNGLDGTRVSAASFAEHRPVDTNRTKEGKASNRRIEIVIVPDMSMMPGFDELKRLAEGGAEEDAKKKTAPR